MNHCPSFKATHRRVGRNEQYELLDDLITIYTDRFRWVMAVRYRNAEGQEFAESLDSWNERFASILITECKLPSRAAVSCSRA